LEAAQARLQEQDPGVCPQKTAEYLGILVAHAPIYARLHLGGTIPVLIGTGFDRWLRFFGVNYVLPDLWRPYMDGGVARLWDVLRQEWARYPPGILLMSVLTAFQLGIYVIALLGVLSLLGTGHPARRWILVALVLALTILVLTPGQGGNERFRVPAQPLLLILACYGLSGQILRSNRRAAAQPEAQPPSL
jgi:hypothetical protein